LGRRQTKTDKLAEIRGWIRAGKQIEKRTSLRKRILDMKRVTAEQSDKNDTKRKAIEKMWIKGI
jgi:uncharacterized phage protein gp47/JayE